MSKLTEFDRTDIYTNEVEPLVKKLMAVCREHQIPCFLTFALANSEEGTVFENLPNGALPMGIYLKDDRLVEHLKVAAGFQTMAPDTIPEVELG